MAAQGVEPDYLALVRPDTFAPVARLDGEAVLVAVAARVGGVRLIDNTILSSPDAAPGIAPDRVRAAREPIPGRH